MMEMCYSMPAVMGVQGGKVFYTVIMSMRVLVRMLRIDDAGSVLDRSQRKVNPARAKSIGNYMVTNPTGYFLPGIIGVVEVPTGGDAPKFEASEISGVVGVLKVGLDSIIKLFDGQHRATGIAKALEKSPEIAQDSISITLYMNLSLQERQQAFTDINQNASKPPQGLSDTYNHRDELSKLTMDLVKQIDWMQGRVDFATNKPTAQSEFYWSFKQIKDATAIMLGTKKNFEPFHAALAYDFWNTMGAAMEFQSLGSKERETSLFTTTVMLKALASAANEAESIGQRHWRHAYQNLVWSRDSQDFTGRCICPKTGKLLANADAVTLTSNLILKTMSQKLDPVRASVERTFFPEVAA
nr:DGQHR domain-containing protein [uncultured Shewanella sp.]